MARASAIGGNSHFGNATPSPGTLTLPLLAKLTRMLTNYNVSEPNVGEHENRGGSGALGVPAGYTYLLQLVAHDLVFTAEEIGVNPAIYGQTGNLRRAQLELETLLGGGPRVCPYIYDRSAAGHHTLRLGNTRPAGATGLPWTGALGDVPRFVFSPDGQPNPAGGISPCDSLLADPRNDDNVILSQLTVVFHKLFNRLAIAATGSPPETSWRMAAGETVTIFRRIILRDLLPRILHPDVLRYYSTTPIWLDGPRPNGSVAFEFAFAAGRIAHSMIRPLYRLNSQIPPLSLKELLSATPQDPNRTTALLDQWRIDWKLFFTDNPAATPTDFNWAVRFGPRIAATMQRAAAAPAPNVGLGQATPEGVTFRDFLRGQDIGAMGPADFAKLIARSNPGLANMPFMADLKTAQTRRALIESGLRGLDTGRVWLSDAEVAKIANNPPLLLYLMFEARASNNGATLGPLGSIIFAEAMRKVFDDAKASGNYPVGPLERQVISPIGAESMIHVI